MAIINASSGFQLFMSGSGDIPELQSGWSTAGQVSASDEFSARLLATGSFSTTYTISVAGAFHYNALSNGVTGTISSLTLSGSSASPYGQNGPLLTITGANAEVNNASMLPLSLFLRGDDLITGSVFNDVIQSQEGNDFLQGGSGNDALYGGDNSDVLAGGPGRDWLSGGGDTDTFVFSDASHTQTGGLRDVIVDFNKGIDLIDLRGIDADTDNRDGGSGDQAFNWIGKGKFGDIDGQLRMSRGLIQGDTDGDGRADFEIKVNVSYLKATDFASTSDILL